MPMREKAHQTSVYKRARVRFGQLSQNSVPPWSPMPALSPLPLAPPDVPGLEELPKGPLSAAVWQPATPKPEQVQPPSHKDQPEALVLATSTIAPCICGELLAKHVSLPWLACSLLHMPSNLPSSLLATCCNMQRHLLHSVAQDLCQSTFCQAACSSLGKPPAN